MGRGIGLRGLAALGVLLSFACAAPDPAARAERPASVVLISLDGTRPADLTPDRLPSLLAVGQAGAIGDGLIPVDPSNTFPNHVSLATGARPEVHRLVNNGFVDPVRGRFRRQAPHEWIEAEPIWSVAERNGVPSASYFWVGSEGPWSGGPAPGETRRFSSRTTEKTKVNRILEWLGRPDPETRPRLIVAWFHGADHEAHEHGPDSPEVAATLTEQDAQIARLVAEMERRDLFSSTTLIFVSDHGMAEAERRVALRDRLRSAGLRASVIGIGGFSSISFSEKSRNAERIARAVRVARAAGLEAFPRMQAPRGWYVDDPRFGDIVVRAPIGTAIVGSNTDLVGFHGYDARAPEMAALLVARGRGVLPGSRVERVSNLSVAPTVLRLLGLPIPDTMRTAPIEALLVGVPEPGIQGARGPASKTERARERAKAD